MKPVNNWDSVGRGYSFKEKTWYSQYHLGLDLMTPTWTPLYAPFNGYASNGSFTEGGNVINFACNGLVMRFMHLAKISKTGYCNAGDLIGYTGNSGTLTTGAHLHVDISKGSVQKDNINNFLDPETFNWEGDEMTPEQLKQLNQATQDIAWIANKTIPRVEASNQTAIDSLKAELAALKAVQGGLTEEEKSALSFVQKIQAAINIFKK